MSKFDYCKERCDSFFEKRNPKLYVYSKTEIKDTQTTISEDTERTVYVATTNRPLYKYILEKDKASSKDYSFYEYNLRMPSKATMPVNEENTSALLVEEGAQTGTLANYNHKTIILANDPNLLVPYVQPVVDGHCESSGIKLNYGPYHLVSSYKRLPPLSFSAVVNNEECDLTSNKDPYYLVDRAALRAGPEMIENSLLSFINQQQDSTQITPPQDDEQ